MTVLSFGDLGIAIAMGAFLYLFGVLTRNDSDAREAIVSQRGRLDR